MGTASILDWRFSLCELRDPCGDCFGEASWFPYCSCWTGWETRISGEANGDTGDIMCGDTFCCERGLDIAEALRLKKSSSGYHLDQHTGTVSI